MRWGKDELEAVWNSREVSFCFFGNVGGMIIEDHSNLNIRGMEVIKFVKKVRELCTSMPVLTAGSPPGAFNEAAQSTMVNMTSVRIQSPINEDEYFA